MTRADKALVLLRFVGALFVLVAVIPPYLYLDFRRRLTAAQAVAVKKLFEDRFRQVLIEFRGEARSFADGGEAMSLCWAGNDFCVRPLLSCNK